MSREAGSRVEGVADNAPFSGIVLDTRPTTHPFTGEPVAGRCDYLIQPDGGGQPWWAWHFEVDGTPWPLWFTPSPREL